MGGHLGLHFHRLKDDDGVSRRNFGARLHEPLHHSPGHVCAQLAGIAGTRRGTAVVLPVKGNARGDSPAGTGPAVQQRGGQADGETPAVDVNGNGAPLTVRNGRAEFRIRRDGLREVRLDPAGVDAERGLGGEVRRLDHRPVERQDCGHAGDLHFGEGAAGPAERLLPVGAGDDQLGQQGIELRRHNGAGADPGVQADTGSGRAAERGNGPGRREESPAHVLGVKPKFEGVATRLGIGGETQRLAGGNPELLLDQIDAGGLLGDGVLHLQARVHLEERDGAVSGHQELHRPGPRIGGFAADCLGGVVNLLGLLVCQEGCGGLFHQFLVPALQRAVAGAHHHHVAVLVRQDLRLHVPGPVQVALHKALAAAEGHHRFTDRRIEGLLDLVHVADHFQPAPAATEGRFDGDGQAVLFGEPADRRGRCHRTVAASHQGGAGPHGDLARRDLVAQLPDGLRSGSDPGQAGVQHRLGKAGVLGQEAVAGVHRIRPGFRGHAQEVGDVQVGFRWRVAAQAVRLGGGANVHGVGIDVRVDSHGLQSGVLAGTGDADGDFSAVGDQDLAHQLLTLSRKRRGKSGEGWRAAHNREPSGTGWSRRWEPGRPGPAGGPPPRRSRGSRR